MYKQERKKIPAAIASATTTASTAAASPPGIGADLDTHLVVQALAAVEIPARIPLHRRARASESERDTHRQHVSETIDHLHRLHHSRRETDTA